MEKKLRGIVWLMVAVCLLCVGGLWLWAGERAQPRDSLSLGPWDHTVRCGQVEENLLICNDGRDAYLFLDDVAIYRGAKKGTLAELTAAAAGENGVDLRLWLTDNGKVHTIEICEDKSED